MPEHPTTYLDWAAAAPPRPEVLEGHAERRRASYFNPHSTHRFSEACQRQIRLAERRLLACLEIPADDAQVVWTSGGTEANNLGIFGVLWHYPGACALVETSGHKSLLQPCRASAARGWHVTELPVDGDGRLAPERLSGTLPAAPRLAAVCHVNNETGAQQDLPQVRRWLDSHTPGALLLADAAQSFGKLDIPWGGAKLDLLTFGARKIGGPSHVGALVLRRGTPLEPILFGGDQQDGLRAGTVDTVGILEFVAAAEVACARRGEELRRIGELNRLLRERLQTWEGPEPLIISPQGASPYILSVAIPGYEGAIVMRALAERNVIVATGSACTAEAAGTSHVLKAMGLPQKVARATLRISFGWDTNQHDIDRLVQELTAVLAAY